ncbi:MFS general substrate transporter [Aspergillus ellipticus CBS 707.79]|uniref:MFS general substrate transporter n=1 Tax=Aspergillus ellipticus CBS 707.79 TaxID=1448320 RepID=A0A319CUL8_9EURO|nr:MFS general substrate transporter [Aspergillus ellipticus CBS 707.79]
MGNSTIPAVEEVGVDVSSQERSFDARSVQEKGLDISSQEGKSVDTPLTEEPPQKYIQGLRLHVITGALCLCLFLTNLEIPIVTTALISISSEIGGLNKIYWITTAYLLGYAGLLVLTAKFSDLIGRKTCLLFAVFMFTVFSAACGAAQTMEQLIIFRAFQGIGGAGNYSLCTVIVMELVPPEKFAVYTSSIAVVYVFSLVLGPLFGGAITQHTTWRWVFLLNVPPAVIAGIVLVIVLPNRFPHHNTPPTSKLSILQGTKRVLRRADILGSLLLLAATLLLVTALEEADEEYSWKSAFTIALLTISGILWIMFFLWERLVTLREGLVEPVFPWRFMKNRVWLAMLLNAICLGATWFVTMFELPQRFQIVNALSPFDAAVRFIAFTLAAPIGSIFAPTIGKKFKVPLLYLVLFASCVQVIAYALLGTFDDSLQIHARQYGYQILAGFGCGINISLLILMTPFAVEKRDGAVAMGSVAQFRIMGGCIGLAIVTAVSNSYLRTHLGEVLSPETAQAVLKSVDTLSTLPAATQTAVRQVYSASYNLQMKVLAGFAGGQIIASFLMWDKNPIVV